MKYDLYYENLLRNKKMISDIELIPNINIISKYNNNDIVINRDNIDSINISYLKKNNFKYKRIVIDCSLFDIFDSDEVKKIEDDKEALLRNKFNNIYLSLGNNVVDKCFEVIKLISTNYDIDSDIYIFNYIDRCNYFINDLYYLITSYNIKDKRERYSYIYDVVCNELDRRFNKLNLCDFKDSKCIRKRNLVGRYEDNTLNYGCCFTKGRVCEYLSCKSCNIASIGCKFFTCNYLKRRGINYKPNDFLIIRKFYSKRDIRIINNYIYTTKEDTLDIMLNN